MAFSIEALQSKSKLNNVKSQQFQRTTFWPELMPPDNDTIILAATHNIKSALLSVLAKVKDAMGSQTSTESRRICHGNEAEIDVESIVVVDGTNCEGFVEVSLTKEK